MAFIENVLMFLRGFRKLTVTLLTLLLVGSIFGVCVALLITTRISGAEFADVSKAMGAVISTIVVAFMGTNMVKHLLDAGKECVNNYIAKRKKK